MEGKSQQEPSQTYNQSSKVQRTNVQRKTQNRILRIHADDYSTKHLAIFWTLYIGLIICFSLLTLACNLLPPTFIRFQNKDFLRGTPLQNCTNPVGFDLNNSVYCRPISETSPTGGLITRGMEPKNQFILVYMNVVLENISEPFLQISQKAKVQVYPLVQKLNSNSSVQFFKASQPQNMETIFELKSYQSQRIYQPDGFRFRGYRKFWGYQNYVEEQTEILQFTFIKWPLTNVKDFFMDIVTISPSFTVFTIVIRYILFAVSLATTIGYYVRYRLIPEHLKTIEQKMILYLSIFTVMFNDPLYAATILKPNGFTAFTSVACIVNFLTFLMLFWMVMLDRIYYQSGEKHQKPIDRIKIAYVALFYISLFVLQFQLALFRINGMPIIPGYEANSGGIAAFEVISFIIFACGLIYIGVQFTRSAMNFFDKIWRNQMFLLFSFIFIVIIVVMLLIDGFSVYEYTGSRLLILFTFMNTYTLYLQYMYSITGPEAEKLDRARIFGDEEGNKNQVETIVSNFGNDQIMVDLDSQPDAHHYQNNSNNQNPLRVNKYSDQMKRLQSSQENHVQQDTNDNLAESNKNAHQFEKFEMED